MEITEIQNGIEARFPDGHCAMLTIDGMRCTCGNRPLCQHVREAIPAYKARKWALAEANQRAWGKEKYRRIGIDAQIFYPPKVVWHETDGEWVRMSVQSGQLYIFRDGASLWISEKHPLGGTACSECGTRDCQHWQMATSERQAVA